MNLNKMREVAKKHDINVHESYGVGKLLIAYVDLCKTGLEALLK